MNLHQKSQSPNAEMLWNQFRAGDIYALEAIYRDHFKCLYQYGMTIYPNNNVVKDAIQDLFTSLVQGKDSLTAVQNVTYYLIKSLRNKIYDEIKGRKKADLANMTFNAQEVIFLTGEETKIISEELSIQKNEKLMVIVNNLPERQREIVMLIFFEGKSYEDVSKLMSLTVNSAYKLTWKAINSLKIALKSGEWY